MNFIHLLTLLRKVKIRSFKKGELLISEGCTKTEIFFIRKGLVRGFHTPSSGDEVTFQLYPETYLFTNIHSLLFDGTSKFSYEALEPTKAYVIDHADFIKVTSQNANLSELSQKFMGKRVIRQAFQRIESFVLLSPEERYLKYVQDFPNVVNRAPDKYIANVLGITPVSLSRIRSRIATRKA
ncbi:MAG: Crp/Fnr family transcriptional regulator [Bacteroidota bacterium]